MDPGFDEFYISVDRLQKVCRVCLSQSKILVPINQVNLTHRLNEKGRTEKVDLVSVFLKFCDIEVSSTDCKPSKICELCLDLSLKAFNFFQKCIWVNQLLDYKIKLFHYKNYINVKNIKLDHEYENVSIADNDYSDYGNEDVGFDLIEHCDTVIEDENAPAILRFELVPKKMKIPRSKEDMDEAIQSLLPVKKDPKPVKKKPPVEYTAEGEEIFTCKFCETSVKGFNEFVDHCVTQHPEKNKSCALCSYEVRRATNKPFHIFHMAKKHSRKSIVCDFCSMYFKSQEDLDSHNNIIDHENKKCLICNMDFSHKRKAVYGCILSHVSRVHELQEKNFLCSHCGKAFKYPINLRRHIEVLHEGKRVLCQHCGADFTTVYHLNSHAQSVHGAVLNRRIKICYKNSDRYKNNENDPESRTFLCPANHCGRKFKSLHRVYVHTDLHKLEFKDYQCQICSEVYVSFADLIQHQIQNHQTYACSKCNEKFVLKSDWLFHTRLGGDSSACVNQKSSFRCTFCPKVYGNPVRFYFHSRVHPEFKDYICSICSRAFHSYSSYSKHYEVHRTHVCQHPHCGKGFVSKHLLKAHSATHSSKTYSCKICNSNMVSAPLLRQHVRTVHLNERLYKCKTCGKSFKQMSHLTAHQTQHGFQKPWKCEICGARFLFQSLLNAHWRVHTGEKPYQCLYCSKAFRDTTTRHKHIKKQHLEFKEEYLEYRKNHFRKNNAVIEENSEAEIHQEAEMAARNLYSGESDYDYKFIVPADFIETGETVIYDDGEGMSNYEELDTTNWMAVSQECFSRKPD